MSVWFDPTTGLPFWNGSTPMWTAAASLCCACKWTWTATCTAPSGSWAVSGPTKECVQYTNQHDSTAWTDCSVNGSTVTKKWYKYTLLDGCCTGDCENHTEPDFTPEAPTGPCGCVCPEDCSECMEEYAVSIPAGGFTSPCMQDWFGQWVIEEFEWDAVDTTVVQSNYMNCIWSLAAPITGKIRYRQWVYPDPNCGGTPNTAGWQETFMDVSLHCANGTWVLDLTAFAALLMPCYAYRKSQSACPDGTYSEGATVE